jgi:hypothetical protein
MWAWLKQKIASRRHGEQWRHDKPGSGQRQPGTPRAPRTLRYSMTPKIVVN